MHLFLGSRCYTLFGKKSSGKRCNWFRGSPYGYGKIFVPRASTSSVWHCGCNHKVSWSFFSIVMDFYAAYIIINLDCWWRKIIRAKVKRGRLMEDKLKLNLCPISFSSSSLSSATSKHAQTGNEQSIFSQVESSCCVFNKFLN